MSRENVEVIQRAGEAFNRHDLQALSDLSHEDLEFVSVMTAVDAGEATYHGKRTWARYFELMDQTWEEWQIEDLRAFDAGDDRAAAVFRLIGTGKHSGARAGQTIGVTYEFREGKLWRMRSYLDPSEALEAVGLRE